MNDITVLKIVSPINEADSRVSGRGIAGAGEHGPGYINQYDWRVWSGSGFGKRVQQALGGGRGYAFEVTDLGKVVVVKASYHCSGTGKTISKTFAITFDDPKLGNGSIYATSTKWRTFTNPDQAASYINSVIRSLTGPAESGN